LVQVLELVFLQESARVLLVVLEQQWLCLYEH
jgi:hypothetical protein